MDESWARREYEKVFVRICALYHFEFCFVEKWVGNIKLSIIDFSGHVYDQDEVRRGLHMNEKSYCFVVASHNGFIWKGVLVLWQTTIDSCGEVSAVKECSTNRICTTHG